MMLEGQEQSTAMKKKQRNCDKRHALAREALLNCVDISKLISIYDLKLAPEMWKKLYDEHGQTSLIEHSRAENA